jgi:peptide/nickel transport system substrate-binding protein
MKKIFAAGMVVFALLIGSGELPAQETALRVAQVADISNPDPHKANDIYTANVILQLFNNLVKMNKKMEIQRDLAESWDNPDAKTWVFHLKKGVKFHNGEEFTAEDVKFTMERILDPKTSSPGKRLVSDLEKVEVLDRYTVRLTTKQPFAPLLTNLTRYEMAMLNKKAVTEAGEDFGKRPIGTGPFMFSERHHGDRVVLTRFDGYFEGPAKVKTIVYRAIPEDATRVVEMESGGIDILYNLPPQDFDRLGKNPNIETIEELFQATTYLGFNAKVKPFENKRVRQALNYAVDKKAIIEAVWFNRGTPSYGPMSPSIWGFDPTLAFAYPYDPEKAKELLKQAGYANGFDTVIWTDPRTERRSICEMVQAYFAQVGVNASIEAIEWGKFLVETRTGNGAKGLYIMGWTGTGDADGAVFSTFHSSGIGSNNRNFWSTPELDKLMEEGRTTLDLAKRKEIYAKVQRMIVEEAPNLFIGIPKNLAAVRKGVNGFELFANNINPLYNVTIGK